MRSVIVTLGLCTAGLSISGCAEIESVARQGAAATQLSAAHSDNRMIGRNSNELIETYGEPDAMFDVGGGRSAYVYSEATNANDAGEECNDSYVVSQTGRIIDYYCR